jgi:hypothetical protein
VLKRTSLQLLNVDRTVEEKAVSVPTDSKFYHNLRIKLAREAKIQGIELSQTYTRKSKQSLAMQSRYAHAQQIKRSRKVSITKPSKDNFVVGAQALHNNPYDGHTLNDAKEQAERLGDFVTQSIFVDRGYRGHNYEGEAKIHLARQGIRKVKPSLRRWLKRRSAIEPVITHMKMMDIYEETICSVKKATALTRSCLAQGTISESF